MIRGCPLRFVLLVSVYLMLMMRTAVSVLVVLAVLLAACGGGADDAAGGGETRSAGEPAQPGTAPTEGSVAVAALVGEPSGVANAPVSVGLGFNNAEQIVDAGGGNTHVVWVAGEELQLATRDDRGNVLDVTTIATGRIILPAITRSGQVVAVAWVEQAAGGEVVQVAVSGDGGGSFSAATVLGKGSGVSLASSGASIIAVWHEGREGEPAKIMFRRYGGGSWSGAARIDASTASPVWPSVAQHGERVFVTWRDDRDGPYSVWLRRSLDGGVTWEPEQQLVTDLSGDPDVCAPDDSTVYVAHHGKGRISLLRSDDAGASFRDAGDAGSGYFAHLSCTDSIIAIAWEATEGSARAENKAAGWAVYDASGASLGSGTLADGDVAAATVWVVSPALAELVWVQVGADPLAGSLRHQFISMSAR